MQFKDIKQNYPVYILDKQELTYTQGKVVSVSFPRLDTNKMSQMPSVTNPMASTQMVVDVTIEANGKTATYTIPESLAITYTGNLVLSTDKDGISREVEALKASAEQVLASVDHQKEVLEKATSLLAQLSPSYREKKETEERFTKLESSVSDIKSMIENFVKEFKS